MKISIEFTLGEKFDRDALAAMMAQAGILAASLPAAQMAGPAQYMRGYSDMAATNAPVNEPEASVTDDEALEHDVQTAEATATGAEPLRRRRRTKAEIEADEKAAQQRTLQAAGQAGLIPPGPPVPSTSPVPAGPPRGIVLPPGAAAGVTAASAPPSGPPVLPQAPSMPAPPPPSEGGPTVVDLREMQRSMQASHPNLAFKIMKQHGFFTPEMVAAAGKIDFIMEQLAAAMAAA